MKRPLLVVGLVLLLTACAGPEAAQPAAIGADRPVPAGSASGPGALDIHGSPTPPTPGSDASSTDGPASRGSERKPARARPTDSVGSGGLGSGGLGTGGLGSGAPQTDGIVLGRTIDEAGKPHTLVLQVPSDVQAVIAGTGRLFAVASGSKLSVSGDAAVGAWRFMIDSSTAGDAAPIVVYKGTDLASVEALAGNPARFSAAASLNDDAVGTSNRLSTVIATVIARAASTSPESELYEPLARVLQDPSWTGVVVFNAAVTVPAAVQGEPTGAMAGALVPAYGIGFSFAAGPMHDDSAAGNNFFATVDHPRASANAPRSNAQHLRAAFANGALTHFEMSVDQ